MRILAKIPLPHPAHMVLCVFISVWLNICCSHYLNFPIPIEFMTSSVDRTIDIPHPNFNNPKPNLIPSCDPIPNLKSKLNLIILQP